MDIVQWKVVSSIYTIKNQTATLSLIFLSITIVSNYGNAKKNQTQGCCLTCGIQSMIRKIIVFIHTKHEVSNRLER